VALSKTQREGHEAPSGSFAFCLKGKQTKKRQKQKKKKTERAATRGFDTDTATMARRKGQARRIKLTPNLGYIDNKNRIKGEKAGRSTFPRARKDKNTGTAKTITFTSSSPE